MLLKNTYKCISLLCFKLKPLFPFLFLQVKLSLLQLLTPSSLTLVLSPSLQPSAHACVYINISMADNLVMHLGSLSLKMYETYNTSYIIFRYNYIHTAEVPFLLNLFSSWVEVPLHLSFVPPQGYHYDPHQIVMMMS